MSNTFTVTYANGMTEDVQLELETVDEVANQLFGTSLEAAQELGANVVLVGEFVPEDPDLTGTINEFTATNPTVVTTDVEDHTILTAGMMLELEPLEGDQATGDHINGRIVEVLSVSPRITLDLDLSTYDVTGLRADYTILVEEPEEEPGADTQAGGGEDCPPDAKLETPATPGGWVPSA